jgi:hypothetical protein
MTGYANPDVLVETEWGNSVGVPIANPSLVDMAVEDPRPDSALTQSVA